MSVYVNGVEQAPPVQQVFSPIPPAGPEWEGITLNHTHLGGKTELMTCLQNQSGVYEWIKIAEST